MAAFVAGVGAGLVTPTPQGATQDRFDVGERGVGDLAEKPSHLRHGHGDEFGSRAVLLIVAPFWAAARVATRKAWANKLRVMWRYHPSQRRTS